MAGIQDLLNMLGLNSLEQSPTGQQAMAQQQLQQQGSVMGQPQQSAMRRDPLLGALLSVLDVPAALGPTPVDAFSGGAAKAAGGAGLAQLLQGLLGGGGQPQGADEAGIFRQLGMQRAGGLLNPAEYLMQLQSQPNYQRYLQLVQGMVKRGLGEQFPVARGKAQTDPLIQALQAGRGGSDLPVTAVTHGVNPEGFANFAENFAQNEAYKTRKPTYVAQGTATPGDVAALVPRRQAYSHEKELILKPTAGFAPQLAAKYIPPSSAFPWAERKALGADPNSYTQDILNALAQAAQPPAP